jgi:hypothetical protein
LSLDRCLFLARVARGDDRDLVAQRVEALARWHGGATTWRFAGDHVAAGVVRYDQRGESLDDPLVFGEPLPAELRALADAGPAELRALEGAGAALAIEDDRATLVAYAGGPGTLFAASCGAVDAWSTHAVAAAWLAHGEARVDAAVLPEQLAAEFVGGERSLIAGARALPQAVRVVAAADGARLTDYWPSRERWAELPEEDAAEHTEQHLLATLGRRVRAFAEPRVSLTAGLDSRVAGVALRELGVAARGFTWGEPDWDDVRGGAELAERLGIAHEVVGIEWLGDDEALRETDRQVRWTEGAVPIGFARLGWPDALREPAGGGCFVTGAGGEVGRAFYYAAASGSDGARAEELLVDLLAARLAGARGEAVRDFAAALHAWVDEARAAGAEGLRALDVVYGEQRVRRWLRGMLPRLAAPMIPAFATPEVARGLMSLPLAERTSDGFHRGFLERHAPELVPAAAPPAPRRRRLRLPQIRRGPSPAVLRYREPAFLAERWEEHPGFRSWIAEEVLASPLLTDPLGERWAARTRKRFLDGDGAAERLVLAAAAPVALDRALRELRV